MDYFKKRDEYGENSENSSENPSENSSENPSENPPKERYLIREEDKEKDAEKDALEAQQEGEVLEGYEEGGHKRDSSYAAHGLNQENKWYREGQEKIRSAFEYAYQQEQGKNKSKEREAEVNDGEAMDKGEAKAKGRTKARENAKERKRRREHLKTQQYILSRQRMQARNQQRHAGHNVHKNRAAHQAGLRGNRHNVLVGASMSALGHKELRALEKHSAATILQNASSRINVTTPITAHATTLRTESVTSQGTKVVTETTRQASNMANMDKQVIAGPVVPKATLENVQKFTARSSQMNSPVTSTRVVVVFVSGPPIPVPRNDRNVQQRQDVQQKDAPRNAQRDSNQNEAQQRQSGNTVITVEMPIRAVALLGAALQIVARAIDNEIKAVGGMLAVSNIQQVGAGRGGGHGVNV